MERSLYNIDTLGTEAVSTLNTPTVPMDEPLWGRAKSAALTSGLFNTLDSLNDNGSPFLGPFTTSEPISDREDTGLDALDPQEVDRLLAEMMFSTDPSTVAPDACVEPVPDFCLPDTPSNALDHVVLHGLSNDHDYLERGWADLSEFLDLTKLPTPTDEMGAVIDATMLDDVLQAQPDFMDTFMDLEQFLYAEEEAESSVQDDEASQSASEVTDNYRKRRIDNNRASRLSRQTRKKRRVDMEGERTELELKNAKLKAEIERLESLAKEWKDKLLTVMVRK